MENMTGWLSKHGIFYICSYSEHYDRAKEICERMEDYDLRRGRNYEDTYETDLESFGWLKIQRGVILEPRSLPIGEDLFITTDQKVFLDKNLPGFDQYNLRIKGKSKKPRERK